MPWRVARCLRSAKDRSSKGIGSSSHRSPRWGGTVYQASRHLQNDATKGDRVLDRPCHDWLDGKATRTLPSYPTDVTVPLD